MDEKKIIRLLADWEHALLDFKETFYNPSESKSKTDFVKDVLSMANSTMTKPGYIVCGVKVLIDGRKEVVGIHQNTLVDDNNWVGILNQFASHPIEFRLHKIQLTELNKTIAVIEIFEEQVRPIFCIKADGEKLQKGLIYFRNGSNNDFANDLVTVEKMILGSVRKKQTQDSISDPTYNRYSKFPPAPYYNFVGRRDEINKVKEELLLHHKNYLLALNGDGGIGKTSIAYKIAEELLTDVDNGKTDFDDVIWISAKDQRIYFDQRLQLSREFNTLEDLYEKILLVFYDGHFISKQTLAQKESLVSQALQDTKFLFVLDNLEVFSQAEIEGIKTFISRAPSNHKFLLTSRHDLRVQDVVTIPRLDPENTKNYIEDVIRAFDLLNSNVPQELNDRQVQFDDLTSGNPLYIKFFISQMKNGRSLDDILSRRNQESEKALMAYCFDTTLANLKENEKKIMYSLAVDNSSEKQQISFNELRYLTLLQYQELHELLDNLTSLSMVERTYTNGRLLYSINNLLGAYLIDEKRIPAAEILKTKFRQQKMVHYSKTIDEPYITNFGLEEVTQPNELMSYNILMELLESKDNLLDNDPLLSEARILHKGNYLVPFLKYHNKLRHSDRFQLYTDIHMDFSVAEQGVSTINELIMLRSWKYFLYLNLEKYDEIIGDIEQNQLPQVEHTSLLLVILATAKSLKAREEYYKQQYKNHDELRFQANEIYEGHMESFDKKAYYRFIKRGVVSEYNKHNRHYSDGKREMEISNYVGTPRLLRHFEIC
ncbi:hypothetical protein FE782_10500 [Paenibacillus antri]|uniref:NB-ARC domain-containing protein n=1 Tax=Paenibacillus antri TaxID=2582848 RepID=A0A5R9GBB8_9BACL|nr:RNA-binding domain-containing protein [Paenibacillus antri]TLS52389.1 hypothetical protein FE782_10500 [Paenibacillus antri]